MTTGSLARPSVAAPVGTERLLAGIEGDGRPTLRRHLERHGPLPAAGDLAALAERASLHGRGGAAFDVATKLRSVAGRGGRAVVVANGAEGEPASGKDKVLLRYTPHLVVDGAVAAARFVGARTAIVAVAASARAERAALEQALGERRDEVRVEAASVPDGFVTGEETALLQALGGGPARPTLKPPYPFERGLRGAPTLVQNVETLAHLALVARFGADWFRSVGAAGTPGTALVTLNGTVARGGVYEIALGTSLADLVRSAGGFTADLGAVLVGGYFGQWVSPAAAESLRLTPDVLGAGAIVALPRDTCGLSECARVVRYLAGESAGQCGPCVNGLSAIADAVERLAEGDARAERQLTRWTDQVSGRGACRHPDGVARFVESALDVFADDVARHRSRRCKGRTRAILPVPRSRR
jgi:NADH:ubiquinone oxidoreductase subunit F (NADH-binding)